MEKFVAIERIRDIKPTDYQPDEEIVNSRTKSRCDHHRIVVSYKMIDP